MFWLTLKPKNINQETAAFDCNMFKLNYTIVISILSLIHGSHGNIVIGHFKLFKTMYAASGSVKKLNSAQWLIFPIPIYNVYKLKYY